jgi:hypothetical protein
MTLDVIVLLDTFLADDAAWATLLAHGQFIITTGRNKSHPPMVRA